MGSIREIKNKNGSVSYEYRVFVKELNKYKSVTGASERKAKKKFDEWYKDFIAKGGGEEKRPNVRILRSVLDAYIDNKTNILSPSTIREYRRIVRNDFQSIMESDVADLTRSDYQAEVNKLCVRLSVKSVMNRFGLVKSALKEQCDIDISVKFPQRVKKDICIPSTDEVRLLLDHVRGTSLELPVMLAAFCGMRRGEICAIDRINTDNTITVNKTQVISETGSYVIKPYAKTSAGNRTVFLPDFVAKTIRNHKNPIIEVNIGTLTKRFDDLKSEKGIRFRFHDLRHFYASLLMSEGIPDKYVVERIGHSTDNMLKTVYQHTLKEKQKEIDKQVNDKLKKLFLNP